METRVRATPLGAHRDDAVVLLVAEGEDVRRTVAAAGRQFSAPYEALRARDVFTGAAGSVHVVRAGLRQRVSLLVLAGRGGKGEDGPEALRRAAATGVRAARDGGARSVSLAVPTGRGPWLRADRAARAVAEGAVIGLYRFEAHKSEKAKTGVEVLTLLAPRGESKRVEKGARQGQAVAKAVGLARDLGNEPGNWATPTYLAETAKRIADEQGLRARIFDESDMERLGMGALLGVSRGSNEEARMIVLTYEPKRRGRPDTVALVGKGLTFDAGGISIKPAAKMEDMKFDMCGGATVLATMQAVAELAVPIRVVGVVPASENLLGGSAYKPGDILKAMNGTTIEVRNTDAEGRLILADALSWTTTKLRPRPKAVIDVATLTGACLVALGDQHAGLVSNDDRLAERVAHAAEDAGDPVWRLPITRGYRKQLESPYADVSNLGTPGAGTITAAAFLEKFTSGLPWAHLDIAGMAWTDSQVGYATKGATGFGVRLLSRLLAEWGR